MKNEKVPGFTQGMNGRMEFHQVQDSRRMELTSHSEGKKIYQCIGGIDTIRDLGDTFRAVLGIPKNQRYKNATEIILKSGTTYLVREKYAYIKNIMDEGPMFICKPGEDK